MAVLWKARHALVKVGNSVTVSSAATLYSQISGTQYEQVSKNVKVKPPEGGTEAIPLLGEDSDGYQNEALDRLRRKKAEVTFDILEGNVDVTQWAVQSTTTSGAASDFTRYNYGDDIPTTAPAVAVSFDDGTDVTNFLLNNSELISAGETGVDGDGHAVRAGIKFECLARDFFEELDLGN